MSQNTRAPESQEHYEWCMQERDTLNVPPPLGGIQLKWTVQDADHEKNNMKQLIKEFKGLYEERLMCLEMDTTLTSEQMLQNKVHVLQSYVNDLADQNQVLVQTIEDLQKEADHKVYMFGIKPLTSDCNTDVSEVELRTLSLDELSRPPAHVPRSSLVQIRAEFEDLKIQMRTKDMVISDLQRELIENLQQNKEVLEAREKLVHLQSELSCLLQSQKDNVKEMAEKDICIAKLHTHVQLLQQQEADAHTQVRASHMNELELFSLTSFLLSCVTGCHLAIGLLMLQITFVINSPS
ncbi:hypothetical protein LDENG_00224680 [Lucifuga dentata]|nr:hypothetical protein LDENG_00224680 [Lucifuga dentata]